MLSLQWIDLKTKIKKFDKKIIFVEILLLLKNYWANLFQE